MLGFAYVQVVIAVVFALTQLTLTKEEKDFAYAVFTAAFVPLSMIPWIGNTLCQDLAPKFGGHLMYNVIISILITAAYYFSWGHYLAQNRYKEA